MTGNYSEGTFQARDKLEIFTRSWVVDEPKALVFIAHGLGEHSGRYKHVAEFFNDLECSCYAIDHRGHGKSGGKRGHIKRFSEYLQDMDDFITRILKETKKTKCYLLGHSLGGLIGIMYAYEYASKLQGAIISSPVLKVKVALPKGKLMMAKIFSVLAPKLSVKNEIDPNLVSRDPDVVKAYIADPLVHDLVTTRFSTEFFKAIDAANARVNEYKIPSLFIQSGADGLVVPEATKSYFDKITIEDKAFKLFDGFYHESFNEPEKERAFDAVKEWLEPRL